MSEQDIKDFKEAHKTAYYVCGFQWKSDKERLGVLESWNSLYPDMVRGNKLVGDCEDVALAIVDSCVYKGVDPTKVGIARIKVVRSEAKYFDHAVAVLLSNSGEVQMVSDCNYPERPLREIKGTPYDFISAETLAMGGYPVLFVS